MRNIIAGVSTLIIVALMGYVASQGGAFNGGEHGKVIENIGNKNTASKAKEQIEQNEDVDTLNALKQKAGNVGGFDVSREYKSNCSSCHGINGSGFQNGKPMMGPKLFGQSEDNIYHSLVEFKSGRRENIVMKGLLMPMDEQDFKRLAKEIGEFPTRAKALKK